MLPAREFRALAGRFAALARSANEQFVATLVAAVVEFGRIGLLVDNSGIYPFHSLGDMTFTDWREVMSVDLDGTVLMVKAVLPNMHAVEYGRIVNVALAEC